MDSAQAEKIDVYAFGVLLWTMWTLELPLAGPSVVAAFVSPVPLPGLAAPQAIAGQTLQ